MATMLDSPGDDEEFAEFMARVDEVSATISGLKDGTVDAHALLAADAERDAAEAQRKAKKAAAAEAARRKAEELRLAAERRERLREEKRDELEVHSKRLVFMGTRGKCFVAVKESV